MMTVAEWRCGSAALAALGAGPTLIATSLVVDDDAMAALGATLFMAYYALGWISSAIEARAGRTPRPSSSDRGMWFLRIALPFAASGVLCVLIMIAFALAGHASDGLRIVGAVAIAGAALAVLEGLSAIAWRMLGRSPGYVPAPTMYVIAPMRVRSWTTLMISAASATAALATAAVVTSKSGLVAAALVPLAITIAALWRRRMATHDLGPARLESA